MIEWSGSDLILGLVLLLVAFLGLKDHFTGRLFEVFSNAFLYATRISCHKIFRNFGETRANLT